MALTEDLDRRALADRCRDWAATKLREFGQ
jgi:hypothetical protein